MTDLKKNSMSASNFLQIDEKCHRNFKNVERSSLRAENLQNASFELVFHI
jgi:hypothetical protein